jgi:hypothetical protein
VYNNVFIWLTLSNKNKSNFYILLKTLCIRDNDESKQFKLQALEERDASNDAAYWAMYPAVISGDRADLWML